jgi:hypothetical protein
VFFKGVKMTLEIKADIVKDAILSALRSHLEEMKEDLKADWDEHIQAIATDATTFAIAAASGDPQAEQNMRHLKAQAQLVGATIAIRESERAIATITRVVNISVQVLGKALVGALLA